MGERVCDVTLAKQWNWLELHGPINYSQSLTILPLQMRGGRVSWHAPYRSACDKLIWSPHSAALVFFLSSSASMLVVWVLILRPYHEHEHLPFFRSVTNSALGSGRRKRTLSSPLLSPASRDFLSLLTYGAELILRDAWYSFLRHVFFSLDRISEPLRSTSSACFVWGRSGCACVPSADWQAAAGDAMQDRRRRRCLASPLVNYHY
jgi:hypothetical protein